MPEEKILNLSMLAAAASGKPTTRKMHFTVLPGGKTKRLKGKRGGVGADKGRKWDKWPDGPLDRKLVALGDPRKNPEDLHTAECRHRTITEVGVTVPHSVNGHPVANAFCNDSKIVLGFRVNGRHLRVEVAA